VANVSTVEATVQVVLVTMVELVDHSVRVAPRLKTLVKVDCVIVGTGAKVVVVSNLVLVTVSNTVLVVKLIALLDVLAVVELTSLTEMVVEIPLIVVVLVVSTLTRCKTTLLDA
jgi:hypothetical protein